MGQSSVKFLLVDDLEENLHALEGLLRRDGLELLKARSGPEALELLLVHDVALALLDVHMPTMDGFELAELMRGTERTRRIPIIFVTAGGADSHRVFRGYEAGAVDFLTKPIDPHILKSKAGVFFELYRQQQEVSSLLEESQRGEAALRESDQQFRLLADTMPQLVWVARPDGYHEFFNRRWYEYTGLSPARSQGEGWQRAFHEADLPLAISRWKNSLASGEPYEVEYRCAKHDGTYRWFLGRAYPFRDEHGVIKRWFGTCTDIQEQKDSEHRLSEALRAREDFLAVAGHELKTPLASLLMHVEGVQRAAEKEEWPPGPRQRLEKAARSGQRLERLINELLDVSRIAAGKLQLEIAPVKISELVEEVIARFHDQAERSHTPIRLDLQSNVTGRWDRARIDQVLTNLLSNAMKYGKGQPVDVQVEDDGACLIMRVRDRGIGVAADDQGKIFERFERAIAAREYGGFGLGLWIAAQVVEASGGSIEVESRPGEGATFTVKLPLNSQPQVSS